MNIANKRNKHFVYITKQDENLKVFKRGKKSNIGGKMSVTSGRGKENKKELKRLLTRTSAVLRFIKSNQASQRNRLQCCNLLQRHKCLLYGDSIFVGF